jgi:ACT domain-containing protein
MYLFHAQNSLKMGPTHFVASDTGILPLFCAAAQRRNGDFMKAVITVTGKDTVGIIADVAAVCAKYRANILDITQTVLSEYFAMIMLTDIDALDVEFADFADALAKLGEGKGLMIHAMHEDIFNTMHHI